jgi:AcrR family transcriptional regulator
MPSTPTVLAVSDARPERRSAADETRRALVAAGRELFGQQGYAATPVEEVVRRAGVTKGALYHHFRDKDDLFRAVVEDVKRDVTNVVGKAFLDAALEPDALGTVTVGCLAFIEAHLDPAVQRITVLDARAVLDAGTRQELDNRYEVAVIRGALRRAMHLGVIDRQPLAPLAHVIAGALSEACALIAGAGDDEVLRDDVRDVVTRLLEGLRPAGGPAVSRPRP